MKGKIAAFYGAAVLNREHEQVATLPNETQVEVNGEPVILMGKGEYLPVKGNGAIEGYVKVAQVAVDPQ